MADAVRVVYATSRWGAPTQTFVRREATAVGDGGASVAAWSLKRPIPSDSAVDVLWLNPVQVVVGAARSVVHRPRAALRVWWAVITRASLANLPRHVWASMVGLAWASYASDPPDLVHCHFGWVSATATWTYAELVGVRYTVVLHAFELHTERLIDRFTPVPLRRASQVFTISERDRQDVGIRWGVSADVIRMGVPSDWLDYQDGTGSELLVVSVGSLVPKKGHADLIRATRLLDPEVSVVIIGDGPERTSLEGLVRSLGLTDRVHFAGQLDEGSVRRIVAGATVFALACRIAPDGDMDGIPVALMEAMAVGTPVVTTRLGALHELVEGVGSLVPPEDPEALASAIRELLHDPERASHAATAARARIAGEWTVEVQAPKVLDAARREETTSARIEPSDHKETAVLSSEEQSTSAAWGLVAGLVDRRRFLVESARGRSVVHLGCVDEGLTAVRAGTGDLLHEELSAVAASLIGVDISAEGLDLLRSIVPGEYIVGDVLQLSEVDLPSRCDLVVAAELIEHLSCPGRFLTELRGYLEASGARAILTTPNSYSWTHWTRFAASRREWVHPDHVLVYSPATLRHALELAGLEVTSLWVHRWQRSGIRQLPLRVTDSTLLRWNPLLGVGLVAEVVPSR